MDILLNTQQQKQKISKYSCKVLVVEYQTHWKAVIQHTFIWKQQSKLLT